MDCGERAFTRDGYVIVEDVLSPVQLRVLRAECDAVTRRTGYLTKYVRLINLEGMTLNKLHREFPKRLSVVMREAEDAYPQLLSALLICHAPGFVNFLFRGFRVLMPPRVIEKVDFLAPKRDAADRERLAKHAELARMPEAVGGTCEPWPPPNARFA